MTENEAIKELKYIKRRCDDEGRYKDCAALEKAIKALEEIQQYRAIGTIEEFKALKEKEERFDRNIKMFNSIGLEIRAKAIDEFAERLCSKIKAEIDDCADELEWIDGIAEKMKK